ncbi:MAG: DUF805 domain-containing protein [Rhodospirillales bacterium]
MLGSIMSFRGRRGRLSYMMVQLLFFSIGFILGWLGPAVFAAPVAPFIIFVAFVAMIWPSLAVTAQRLHDIGASGWWQALSLVPIANFVLLLVLLLAPGQDYENRFGSPAPSSGGRLPAAA